MDSTDSLFLNSSSTSTEAANEESLEWRYSGNYLRLGKDVAISVISILGALGNILLILVAQYMVKVKKKPGYVLLYLLGVADTLALLSFVGFILAPVFSTVNQHNQGLLCDVYLLLRGTCFRSTSLMIVLMSSERVLAAYSPFRYQNTVTVSRMVGLGLSCVLVALLSSIASAMIFGNDKGVSYEVDNGVSEALVLFVFTKTTVVFFVMPSISTAVLNLLIIRKIKQRPSSNATQSSAGSSTTKMLLAVSFVFMISTTLLTLIIFGRTVLASRKQIWANIHGTIFEILDVSFSLTIILNSSANFPVLFITMKSFRNNLKVALGKR